MRHLLKLSAIIPVIVTLVLGSTTFASNAKLDEKTSIVYANEKLPIIQPRNVLHQSHEDRERYGNVSLCGWYATFFVATMVAGNGTDFSTLNNRDEFNNLYAQELANGGKLASGLNLLDIKDLIISKKINNTCIAAIDEKKGALYAVPRLGLENMDLKQPIGLVINPGDNHWIGCMVTIDEKDAVSIIVANSVDHDCTKLPVVLAVYDYFIKKIQTQHDTSKSQPTIPMHKVETKS